MDGRNPRPSKEVRSAMRRALLLAFKLVVVFEAFQWVAGGVICLILAFAVWTKPIPPGDGALLLAARHYRNVGVALFAAFGIMLLGSGLREAVRTVRRRP